MVQDGQFEFNEVLPGVDPREYLPEGFPEQYGIGGKEEQQRQQKMRPDQDTGQAQPNEKLLLIRKKPIKKNLQLLSLLVKLRKRFNRLST